MSSLYTYGTGSNYQSTRFSTVQELLNGILDNNANLIYAEDVRDAVFSLWERVSEVEIIAASAASASSVGMFFQNSDPTLADLGGIPRGTSFSIPQTMQQMFTALLYPYVAPVGRISALLNREYGSSPTITLDWTATKKSKLITSIVVDTQPFGVINGNTQTGTKNAIGTYSIPAPSSYTNTFNITVGDEDSTTTSGASFQWMNKIYWGTINLSSIGNPNFDLTAPNGVSASSVITGLTSSTILGLTGAGIPPGNALTTSKSRTYTQINGDGNYLLFAWPSSVVGALSPTFKVEGLTSNAFSRVRSEWPFRNSLGFTTNYEVWISNTLQSGPLNIIIN